MGETELEASKEGRSLTDFKYACVGYSVYLEKKDSSNDVQNKQAELPFCVGLEVWNVSIFLLDTKILKHLYVSLLFVDMFSIEYIYF